MSDSFPVIYSMLSSAALREFVDTNYNLGHVTNCRLLTRGLNDTYRVDTQRHRFILRVYRIPWRKPTDIQYELDVLAYLSQNGLPVSAPVSNKHGELARVIDAPEGPRTVALFTYAEGTTPRLDEDISFQYGTVVAQIHNLTDAFSSVHRRFHLDLVHLLDTPMEAVRSIMSTCSGEFAYVESWAQTIRDRLPVDRLNYGFCHGDFHDWNTHIADGRLTFFDFDCCGPGFRAYDLAVFLWNLKTNYKDRVTDNWTAFLSGYTGTRPLPDVDRKAIPLFVAARRIWLAGIYLQNEDVWGTAIVNEGFFRSFVDQLKEDERVL